MDTKFVEAGHGPDAGNWGKFLLGRYTREELAEPTRFPGCEGQRVVSLRGNGAHHLWVLDLATGEGARFPINSTKPYDAILKLNDHQILVCPLFEPFLAWLFAHIDGHRETWWQTLPRTVELPTAEFSLFGYRRPGPRTLLDVHQAVVTDDGVDPQPGGAC